MNITNLIPPFSAFVATVWIVGIVPLKVLEPPLFLLANRPQFLLLSLLLPAPLPLLFPGLDVPVLLTGSLVLLGVVAAVDVVDVLGFVVLILIDPDFLHVLVSPDDLSSRRLDCYSCFCYLHYSISLASKSAWVRDPYLISDCNGLVVRLICVASNL